MHGTMFLRLLAAAMLLIVGAAITAFGVITVMYGDPLLTTLIVLGVGLLLVAGAVLICRRALRRKR